jgi:exodeoxyribonuclease VII large subunit
VAIGHEIDLSLAELAADVRASTPSNAAELLVPDRRAFLHTLTDNRRDLERFARLAITTARSGVVQYKTALADSTERVMQNGMRHLAQTQQLLLAYDPERPLLRGYVLLRKNGQVARASQLTQGDTVALHFAGGHAAATITDVTIDKES